jgi:hypothetical protein
MNQLQGDAVSSAGDDRAFRLNHDGVYGSEEGFFADIWYQKSLVALSIFAAGMPTADTVGWAKRHEARVSTWSR